MVGANGALVALGFDRELGVNVLAESIGGPDFEDKPMGILQESVSHLAAQRRQRERILGKRELRAFEVRRLKRSCLRRTWVSALLLLHIVGTLILKAFMEWSFADLYRGWNLKLPLATKYVLAPQWGMVLGCLLLAVWISCRPHWEEQLEAEMRACWQLRAGIRPVRGVMSRALKQTLGAGRLVACPRKVAARWAGGLEWRLERHHEKRKTRLWKATLIGFVLHSFWGLHAVLAPFFPIHA